MEALTNLCTEIYNQHNADSFAGQNNLLLLKTKNIKKKKKKAESVRQFILVMLNHVEKREGINPHIVIGRIRECFILSQFDRIQIGVINVVSSRKYSEIPSTPMCR